MLDRVGIPDPQRRVKDYPHAFSGGMRQRAMIAMALANDPKLLIADEPTTALDVTIQAQILDLLRTLQRDTGMAIVFVTHDLGVVADICDRVVVMYAGQVVEESPLEPVFARPRHPYSAGLLASMPQTTPPGEPLTVIPGQVPSPDAWPVGMPLRRPLRPHVEDALHRGAGRVDGATPRAAACAASGPPSSRCAARTTWSSAPATSDADPDGEPLVAVSRARKDFPVRSALLRREIGAVRAVDGGRLHDPGRPDARAGGRVGLGQVDGGAPPAAAGRADGRERHDRWDRRRRRTRDHEPREARPARRASRHADGVPGPVLVARPAPDDRGDDRGAARGAPRAARARPRRPRPGAARPGGDGPATRCAGTPTSSPAASASASPSPAPSRSTRSCSCSTSRCRRSTCRRSRR